MYIIAKNSKNSIFGSPTFAATFVFLNGAESQKNISGPLLRPYQRRERTAARGKPKTRWRLHSLLVWREGRCAWRYRGVPSPVSAGRRGLHHPRVSTDTCTQQQDEKVWRGVQETGYRVSAYSCRVSGRVAPSGSGGGEEIGLCLGPAERTGGEWGSEAVSQPG